MIYIISLIVVSAACVIALVICAVGGVHEVRAVTLVMFIGLILIFWGLTAAFLTVLAGREAFLG